MKKLLIILLLTHSLFAKNEEKQFWDEVKNSSDVQLLKLYKKRYPHGVFETIADLKIKRLLRSKTEDKEVDGIPLWIKGDVDYKYYGIGDANKHFKGKHYQENLARSRAKRKLQKTYDEQNLSNELMNEYNELLETKTYTNDRGRIYILIYLDNYNLR
jgi:hypothetical protein